MADIYLQLPGEGGGWQQFKQIGTHPISGEPVFAAVYALEPNSIGGGGGGVAGAVQIADATTSSQKLAVSAAGAASVDTIDRAGRLLGHVTVDNASIPVTGTFWQATQPVSGPLTDTQLRATPVPVSGTFWQATQPVSLASGVDVTDRTARLLGHVTVDNASIAVTGTFWQATQPVSIAATVNTDVSDRAGRLLGHVTVDTLPSIPAGTNNIGDVDVLTLPSIPAGNNNIGDVDVVTLPNVTIGAGDVDHDAVNTLKMLQTGGHAASDAPTAVAVGDRVRGWYGLHGEQKVSLARSWTNVGDYRGVTLALAHAAAADAATGGRWWLINPVGSGIAIAVLRVMIYHGFTAAAAQLTIPRITLERVSFTGTASGASITPSKRVRTTTQSQSADAAAVGKLLTASTGLTLTAGEIEHAWLPPTALTAVGAVPNSWSYYGVSERGEDALILAPGEGLVCRQADASATGRSWLNTIDWSEFTT